METLTYFNLTNEGRIKPAKKETFMQNAALKLQHDVIETVKAVNERISIKAKDVNNFLQIFVFFFFF